MRAVDFNSNPHRPLRHAAPADLLLLSIFGGRRLRHVEHELDLRRVKKMTSRARNAQAKKPPLFTNRFSGLE